MMKSKLFLPLVLVALMVGPEFMPGSNHRGRHLGQMVATHAQMFLTNALSQEPVYDETRLPFNQMNEEKKIPSVNECQNGDAPPDSPFAVDEGEAGAPCNGSDLSEGEFMHRHMIEHEEIQTTLPRVGNLGHGRCANFTKEFMPGSNHEERTLVRTAGTPTGYNGLVQNEGDQLPTV